MAKSSHKNSSTSNQKKKRKSTKKNYRQTIITVLMALALIAFVLPDLLPLFTGGSGTRTTSTNSNSNSNSADMAEPTFTKEGELSLISSETGETIKRLDIEKADNDMERNFGMMFRKSMPDTQGMLFLFDKAKQQSFWMKNTLIPLDILFIDENRKINTIHANATPLSLQSLPSNGDAKYVLEVRGGFCQQYEVNIGDMIEWQ